MGAAARRQKKFLESNPVCAFCGGKAEATTIEHCPPRALFQDKQWPEGFEFPACSDCNHGSRNQDLLVAMLARMDPFEGKGDRDGRQIGLMHKANQRYPGLFEKMMPSASEARKINKELGIEPLPGQTHQEVGGVKIPKEVHEAVCIFARKLAKGIYYKETGNIFPDNGCLLMGWFTNADLIRDGKYTVFELLKGLAGDAPLLERNRHYLNDQFEYKLTISPEQNIFIIQAKFGNSFGLVIFGSTLEGRLEEMVDNLQKETQKEASFTVLQSSFAEQ